METTEEKIRRLGIELPPAPKPVGAYVPVVRSGNLVYCSGQLGMLDGKLTTPTGQVPTDVSVEDAQASARQAALNSLAVIRAEVGSLDNVVRIIRVNVFVNSASGFADQPKVANAASELLLEVFGDSGRHSRCAIGAGSLPLNAPVELDIIAEVR